LNLSFCTASLWHFCLIKRHEDSIEAQGLTVKEKGLANISLLSIAPAGSIGTMLGISTGIEPVFRTSYERTTQSLHGEDVKYTVFHKEVEKCAARGGNMSACIDARQVTPENKAKVLGAWQQYIDLAISNTTNFHADATVEDIKQFYVKSWKEGVIGGTVYVDGSLSGVLNDTPSDDTEEGNTKDFVIGRDCPDCGSLLVEQGGCKECPSCGYSPCGG